MSEWPLSTGYSAHQGIVRAPFRLVTFGGPTLIAGTRTISPSPLRAALLGLLAAAPDDGLPTTRVMELLWTPGPSSRLRHRVSQLIYSLNREFAEQLIVKKRHRHYLSKAVATDYQFLEAAMSNGRLMEAAELLRRGFLLELTRLPSEAFSEWLDRTRLELRARIRQAAAEQWTRLSDQGLWKRAVEPARVLLSLNAYDERALRMLIRAQAMAGSVREAEAAFHSFVERSELDDQDWAPQSETQSLVDYIRDIPSRADPRVAGRALDGPPLIGRSAELAALSTAMLPQPAEGLRVVVIRGERGVGKTRLVEEAFAPNLLSGIRMLRCRAPKTAGRSFLDSVLGALAASDAASDLRDLEEPLRATVTGLLAEPQARTKFPWGPPPAEPDQVHRRYLEAIGQLVLVLAANNPIILFIDDFHRIEKNSAEVLRDLVEQWSSVPAAITLAVATESARDRDPLTRLLGDPALQCDITEFSLRELTREAAVELVDTVADGRIKSRVRDRIVELSDQNPFFLLRLAELSLAGQRLPNLDPDDFVPAPRCISDVFSGRLAELDDETERTLQLLSVMGRPLHADTLSELASRSRDFCVGALDRLQRSRLVRKDPSGFVVRCELIRHTVYDQIRMTRRPWIHGRVADHLEDANTTARAELAVHYLHAGMPTKALRYALLGASAAEESGALREASMFFALARRNILDPGTHARMAERLARLHYVRRDTVEGPARLAEAVTELRKVHYHQSALVADIQRVDLLAGSGSFSPHEAVARLRELRRSAEQARHWQAVAKAIDLELHIHRREGRSHDADALAAHARELLPEVEPASRGCLHASLSLHHQGNFDQGLTHARAAVETARRKKAPDELLQALVRLVAIQGARGLITDREAISAVEEGETLARRRDYFVEHYNLLASAGTGYRAIGRLDQARNWFAKAGGVLANVRTWESHVALECKLGELALEMRELEQSAAHFARARQLWTPGMGRCLATISHAGVGLTALRSGDLPVAREAAKHISEPPADWFEDPWVFALFKARLCEWRDAVREGVDTVNGIAQLIEASQPAHWARLKFEEALLRLRHTLPQREETAQTAAEAAANLGIDRRIKVLRAARGSARQRDIPG